jgi:hypothetical protein
MKSLAADDADGPLFMLYIPKLLYRDLAGITDPHHVAELRERDQELFAKHGMFCRKPVPGEFTGEDMGLLTHGAFVVVSFAARRWRRQLGRTQRVTVIKTRGGKR